MRFTDMPMDLLGLLSLTLIFSMGCMIEATPNFLLINMDDVSEGNVKVIVPLMYHIFTTDGLGRFRRAWWAQPRNPQYWPHGIPRTDSDKFLHRSTTLFTMYNITLTLTFYLFIINLLIMTARAAMLTGRLPIRNGFYTDNARGRNGEQRLLLFEHRFDFKNKISKKYFGTMDVL